VKACYAAVLTAVACIVTAHAQTNGTPERFTALAVNMSNQGAAAPHNIEINVDQWATDSEVAAFISTLRQSGSAGVLKMLEGHPTIGFLGSSPRVGVQFTFAMQTPQPDGGRRVLIISSRVLQPKEVTDDARSMAYPFMVIELNIGKENVGQGTMVTTASLSFDAHGNTIRLDNFEFGDTVLTDVTSTAKHASK
jgi:hypothetical protein